MGSRKRIKPLPKVYRIAKDKSHGRLTAYAIKEINAQHMRHRYSEVYYAGEQYNLLFTKTEVKRIVEMWNEGATFKQMLRYLRLMCKQRKEKRTGSELFILLLDLADKEKIKPRENYDLQHFIFGG